jgi:pyruvate dehydrogenase complex dehydrogenase (E1) component
MNETVDGDYQTFKSKDGAYVREHFFGNILKPQHWLQTGLTSRSGP